jgi:hypothetical protein
MEQLKLLMDYTKFHIGIYITLCTGLIAVLSVDNLKDYFVPFQPYLFATLVLFAIAAAFGGLVGSSLPMFNTYEEFKDAKLGPFNAKWIPAQWCTHLEHLFFWLGALVTMFGLCQVNKVFPA